MEILSPIIRKLHDEAVLKKEKKLASLTKLAMEDMEQVQKRMIGGIPLPPPPSEVGDDVEETQNIRVEDTVSINYIGDRYYKCYKLGCQNWMPIKIQQSSLEAIQKLTAHGLLNGEENWEYPKNDIKPSDIISIPLALKNGMNPFDNKFHCSEINEINHFEYLWPPSITDIKNPAKRQMNGVVKYRLIDDLINTICLCYTGPKTDEATQVSIAQVLLTIFVNSAIKIHGVTLLKMIQTLINMTVYSPKPVIQTTSKAILTQMVNLIVSRMEECNQRIKNQSNEESNKEVKVDEAQDNGDLTSLPEIPVESEIPDNSRPILNKPRKADKNYSVIENLLIEKDLLEEDSILVLHLLCHLSLGFDSLILTDQESAIVADSRCRSITLELILSMLNNSGRLFQTDSRFSQVLKRNLCVSLSRNGISTDPVVFELSLSIFIVLFTSFRAPLKSEIEVLFKEIYLRLINMQSSTYYQKSLILQALLKICRNPQAIVDMYVNYDCNIGSSSIFENMMDVLSKVAQGRQMKVIPNQSGKKGRIFNDGSGSADASEDRWLKVRGLRCLVAVINSLVEWSKGSNKGSDSRANTPLTQPQLTESEGLPVVVNKNHLDHVGNYDLSNPNTLYSETSGENSDDPAKIQQSSSKKQLWIHGISTFNQSPKKGLAELQVNGFVSEDPKSVAKFFLATSELNKQAIGNYLGRSDPDAVAAMHAFVDEFDFSRMPFVSALRSFLQSFRLPREAQQIDRILEKFADRYCETNPKEFESADTAYVLAFSVMMLNTDQHSNQVRNKMDQAMFIRNNKGINNGKDLDESFLISIFEDICNKEIIMEEEHFNGELNGPRERLIRYHQETAFLQKKLVSLFQGPESFKQGNIFLSATHSDHVKPMFAIAWYPIIAAFSRTFEEVNDTTESSTESEAANESIQLCLEGFTGSIRISCLYYMEIERNAFISALVKFTSISKLESIRPKSLLCAKTLISLAHAYGEYLDESWELVLEAISRMEQLHLFGGEAESSPRSSTGERAKSNHTRKSLSIDGKVTTTSRRVTGGGMGISQDLSIIENLRNQPLFREKFEELRSQSTLVTIDKIFGNSANFNGLSIIHFYRAICNVSLQEVEEGFPSRPRTFSLHKIVEITYYNMKRIRLEWTQIWKILRPYFNTVGCHEDHYVAALAIDSLRQLSMKFFERAELSQFHTQHDFLKPFEHISRHNMSPAMQDLILQSLSQMINSKAANIKSGWKSMFAVLGHLAAANPSLSVLAAAFQLVKLVFDEHFSLLGAGFVDGVNCLVAFGINKVSRDIAVEAVQLMQACADPFLKLERPKGSGDEDSNGASPDDHLFLSWFPVLSSLSRIVIDAHFESLRDEGLNRLFDTLNESGKLYNQNFWNSVLRSVLIPIFDDVKAGVEAKGKGSDSWIKASSLLIELFENFFDDLSTNYEFLEQMFHLIASTLTFYQNEKLTRHGLNTFKSIILNNSSRFDSKLWELITNCLIEFFKITTPELLFHILPNQEPALNDSKDLANVINHKDDGLDQDENDTELNGKPNDIKPKTEISQENELEPELNGDDFGYSQKLENTQGYPVKDQNNNYSDSNFNDENSIKEEIDIPSELFKCSIHLSLLQMVRELCIETNQHETSSTYKLSLPLLHMPHYISRKWLQLLRESAEFAARFNSDEALRHYLWTSGHVNQLPHLIRQETSAYSTYLQVGFHLYRAYGDRFDTENTNNEEMPQGSFLSELIEVCFKILDHFIFLINEPSTKPREVVNWSYLVIQIFKDISSISWAKVDTSANELNVEGPVYYELTKILPKFYFKGVSITTSDRIEIRQAAQSFLNQIGEFFF